MQASRCGNNNSRCKAEMMAMSDEAVCVCVCWSVGGLENSNESEWHEMNETIKIMIIAKVQENSDVKTIREMEIEEEEEQTNSKKGKHFNGLILDLHKKQNANSIKLNTRSRFMVGILLLLLMLFSLSFTAAGG